MSIIQNIDPFLLQLGILPFIVIGCGIFVVFLTKKIFLGPLITLALNLLYEAIYQKTNYPDRELMLSSWNIVLPLISFLLSLVIVKRFLQNKELSNKSKKTDYTI